MRPSADLTWFAVRYSPAPLTCDGCGASLAGTRGPRAGSGPYILVGHPHVRDEVRGRACSNECVPLILARPVVYASNRRHLEPPERVVPPAWDAL